ncbi:MAG: hypothetical protein RIR90_1568 [Bacteroidota bacterium]|jgi:hypothetical protein
MFKKLLLGLISGLLVYSCTPVIKVVAETSPGANLSQYKSFAFYQLSAQGDTISKGFTERVELFKQAITKELNNRGLTVKQSQPDLLVNIGIAIEEKIQTRQTNFMQDGAPYYVGQRNYKWKSQDIEVGRYRDGTVTIHLVDAKANEMVWQSTAEGVLPGNNAKLPEAIQKAATALFSKYPVAPKS